MIRLDSTALRFRRVAARARLARLRLRRAIRLRAATTGWTLLLLSTVSFLPTALAVVWAASGLARDLAIVAATVSFEGAAGAVFGLFGLPRSELVNALVGGRIQLKETIPQLPDPWADKEQL